LAAGAAFALDLVVVLAVVPLELDPQAASRAAAPVKNAAVLKTVDFTADRFINFPLLHVEAMALLP
jgi:hypothetical protein